MPEPEPSQASVQAPAAELLKVPTIWIAPTILASIPVFLLTLVYFGRSLTRRLTFTDSSSGLLWARKPRKPKACTCE